jgi:hypothetical protein
VLVIVMRVGALDGPQDVSCAPHEAECEGGLSPPAAETEEGGDPED